MGTSYSRDKVMKLHLSGFTAALILLLPLYCNSPVDMKIEQEDMNTKGSIPVLKGEYLGQKKPFLKAELFAPGVVSTGTYEQSSIFSPDGNEFYYTLVGPSFGVTLFFHLEDNQWKGPQVAPFSGKYSDYYPSFSPREQKLYFISKRPLTGCGEPKKDYDIWFVKRIGNRWSKPQNMGAPVNSDRYELHPSLARNGNIYFSSDRKGGKGRLDIYRSILEDGHYSTPENLGDSINTEFADSTPYIAPDESVLIFSSFQRPDGYGEYDLYISFRKEDGSWTTAKNMGNKINTKSYEGSPALSPDGKFFFFTSKRKVYKSYSEARLSYGEIITMLDKPGNGNGDIYWVDARIIKEAKEK